MDYKEVKMKKVFDSTKDGYCKLRLTGLAKKTIEMCFSNRIDRSTLICVLALNKLFSKRSVACLPAYAFTNFEENEKQICNKKRGSLQRYISGVLARNTGIIQQHNQMRFCCFSTHNFIFKVVY